jgi:titin
MKKLLVIAVALLASILGTLAAAPPHSSAAPQHTYLVDSNGDDGDGSIGDGQCTGASGCTLRAAIQEANATPALDEIDFNIPDGLSNPTCVYDRPSVPPDIQPPATAICPTHLLPPISAPLIIDGTTQPGYVAGTPLVQLDGFNGNDVGAGAGVDGLYITAGGSTVKGLWIHGFGRYGINLTNVGGNTIQANWIGDVEDANDDATDPWWPNMNDGVSIYNIPNNVVGGTADADRNIISGNGGVGTSPGYGVTISGSSASGNVVEGNYIGTDAAGGAKRANYSSGVHVIGGPNNCIGGYSGTPPGGSCTGGVPNVISGNGSSGVEIAGATATGNSVYGNFVGTTANGLAALANSSNGVYINGASNNIVGGASASTRNVISKNYGSGVSISGSSSAGNVVQGNYIGADATGAVALGNSGSGVTITNATGSVIGGTAAGARNIISGNAQSGVSISGSTASGNVVEGNYIGTDLTGEVNVHNNYHGVSISGAPSNTIGGTTEAARNIIAFNDLNGTQCLNTTHDAVYISGTGAQNNVVEGNYIGATASGTYVGNCVDGVQINGASKNTIGGSSPGSGNLIAYHGHSGGAGVRLTGTGAHENLVRGNQILGNVEGIYIDGAPTNTIGGTSPGEGNQISFNGWGVEIVGAAAMGNVFQGNGIYYSSNNGVFISSAPGNIIGGTDTGAGNVISGNGAVGVHIFDKLSSGNVVQANRIGTDINGNLNRGNAGEGVLVDNAPSTVIGGTSASARNIISANGNSGVSISGVDSTGTVIQGNYIGTDAAGSDSYNLGNGYDGVRVGANSSGTSIGGTATGAGNLIAFNDGDGVLVDRSTGNGILSNSIFENQGDAGNPQDPEYSGPTSYGLGIDLVSIVSGVGREGAGVTVNDTEDGDLGGNKYQNFPVLTSAVSTGGNTTLQGTFNSTPNTNGFRLEFFSNAQCNEALVGVPPEYGPWDYGEGQHYLGFTTVNTNASGDASVNITFPVAVADGWFITATATHPENNTSEFSQCHQVTAPPTPTPTPTTTPTVTRTPTPTATPRATATPCPDGICPTPPSGDANGDGHVSMVDAMLIAQYVAGLIGPGSLDLAAADVNCSGNVSMVDAMLIAQYVAGLIPEFTCS